MISDGHMFRQGWVLLQGYSDRRGLLSGGAASISLKKSAHLRRALIRGSGCCPLLGHQRKPDSPSGHPVGMLGRHPAGIV